MNIPCFLQTKIVGPREEAETGDGRQRALQSVCRGGEKADLAGQPGAVWRRGLTSSEAVHRGEGGGALQQRPVHTAQLLQPFAQDPAPRGGKSSQHLCMHAHITSQLTTFVGGTCTLTQCSL